MMDYTSNVRTAQEIEEQGGFFSAIDDLSPLEKYLIGTALVIDYLHTRHMKDVPNTIRAMLAFINSELGLDLITPPNISGHV